MDFQEQLSQNVKQATVAALIATVIEDEERTIGDILESLEKDEDAAFLVQTFKELTISKLVEASISLSGMKDAAIEAAGAPGEEEEYEEEEYEEEEGEEEEGDGDELEEGDLTDEDLHGLEDGEEEGEEEEGETTTKAPRKRPRANGKDDALPLHDPDAKDQYQAKIVKFLRQNKDEKGTPARTIRKSVGGDADQMRENLNELIESGRLSFTGQARGTRYHLT